ncbi:uncharacterized protein RCC_06177 [Ramularia collo-cygni]|uniref:Uncharacterized protein n=1 Tax=Ramularia collo-cygni TaxID=112498 RepID=A0A2D3UY03_9PEZI|nr:uncharacterized protein RCC_06177 [Ramularia collo-cygni]CZT20318.1 uncharacterized protein RCC_06177 [Ramularia collo-cygni]
MADLSNDLKMDRPPTYSSTDPTAHTLHQFQQKSEARPDDPYEVEIHASSKGSPSFQLKNKGNTLYYVGHYQKIDTPDLILYAGYDKHGPQLAQASFIPDSKDLKIYIGGLKTPAKDDWDIVRSAGGGMFKDPNHRFETKSSNPAERKTKYYWTKTSDRKLGASRWSPRDYKLVRESDEEVIAVYAERHMGSWSMKGTILFREKMNEFAEMASMMVLLSLLEMSMRHGRAINRAFPSTNSF